MQCMCVVYHQTHSAIVQTGFECSLVALLPFVVSHQQPLFLFFPSKPPLLLEIHVSVNQWSVVLGELLYLYFKSSSVIKQEFWIQKLKRCYDFKFSFILTRVIGLHPIPNQELMCCSICYSSWPLSWNESFNWWSIMWPLSYPILYLCFLFLVLHINILKTKRTLIFT